MKNIDPSEINIINYLTGEMSAEELKQFELQLEENSLLKVQVEEMKVVQDQLKNWSNQDMEVPDFDLSTKMSIHGREDLYRPQPRKWSKFFIPNWLKYAAVFIGFFVCLQIAGLKVNQDGNTILLSFGEPNMQNIHTKQVDDIVAKAMEKYAQAQQNDLIELKNQVNTDLNELNNSVKSIAISNEANVNQLKGLLRRDLDKQYVSLESMINGIEENQRQELEDSFTGLVGYIENNRVKDQLKIQNAFSEIATAINNQQYQTNALLTSISTEEVGLKSY